MTDLVPVQTYSMIGEWNNGWCKTDHTYNPNSKRTCRSKGPHWIKIELCKSNMIIVSRWSTFIVADIGIIIVNDVLKLELLVHLLFWMWIMTVMMTTAASMMVIIAFLAFIALCICNANTCQSIMMVLMMMATMMNLALYQPVTKRKWFYFSSFICLDSQAHGTIFHSHWFNCPELLKYWYQGNIYWLVCSVALRWNTRCNFRPLDSLPRLASKTYFSVFLYDMHSKNIGGVINTLGAGLNYSGESTCLVATINVQFLAMTQGSVWWFSTLPCEVFFPDWKLTFEFMWIDLCDKN